MVSVLFQTHLLKDGSLFPDLAPLLAEATPADIHTLPSLQDNLSVYVASHLPPLTSSVHTAWSTPEWAIHLPCNDKQGSKLIGDEFILILTHELYIFYVMYVCRCMYVCVRVCV